MISAANELRMHPMHERLLEALQTSTWMDLDEYDEVMFMNKFFATMNEQPQWSFFCVIFALPVRMIRVGETMECGTEKPAITICIVVLLNALTNLNSFVWQWQLKNIALSNH